MPKIIFDDCDKRTSQGYTDNLWEIKEINMTLRMIKDSNTVIDVGVNK